MLDRTVLNIVCGSGNRQWWGKKVGSNLLLIVTTSLVGRSMHEYPCTWYRCKKSHNPHEGAGESQFLPWVVTSYLCPEQVLGMFTPFSTAEDNCMELDYYRIKPTFLRKQKFERLGRSKCGTILYQLGCGENLGAWDIEQYGSLASRYWARDPVQVGRENAKYRRYRVQLANRKLACGKDEKHVAKGYKVCCDTRERPWIYHPDVIASNHIGTRYIFR